MNTEESDIDGGETSAKRSIHDSALVEGFAPVHLEAGGTEEVAQDSLSQSAHFPHRKLLPIDVRVCWRQSPTLSV